MGAEAAGHAAGGRLLVGEAAALAAQPVQQLLQVTCEVVAMVTTSNASCDGIGA
jgi:hypothetical protein